MKSWSYSKYNLYCQCPYKYKRFHVDYEKQAPSDALKRGIRVHQEIEDFLNGTRKATGTRYLRKQLSELKDCEPLPEEKISLTKDWEPTEWKQAFLRGKIDAVYAVTNTTLKVIDFKTGKIRAGYEEQVELYAASAFSMFEGYKKVLCELWYVDQDKVIEAGSYTVRQHKKLKSTWDERIVPMSTDKKFAKTPNQYCGWCQFSKKNGGECEY